MSVEVVVNDQVSLEKFEAQIVEIDEVVEMRRVPGISRTISHQTMKVSHQTMKVVKRAA